MPHFSPSNSLGDVASLAEVYTSSAHRAGSMEQNDSGVIFHEDSPRRHTSGQGCEGFQRGLADE